MAYKIRRSSIRPYREGQHNEATLLVCAFYRSPLKGYGFCAASEKRIRK